MISSHFGNSGGQSCALVHADEQMLAPPVWMQRAVAQSFSPAQGSPPPAVPGSPGTQHGIFAPVAPTASQRVWGEAQSRFEKQSLAPMSLQAVIAGHVVLLVLPDEAEPPEALLVDAEPPCPVGEPPPQAITSVRVGRRKRRIPPPYYGDGAPLR